MPPPRRRPLYDLADNRARILSRIENSCREAGREPGDVRLVAVTKKVSCEVAEQLHACGCTDLGENRVAEFERKHDWFAQRDLHPRWHFIGHIQRNKARRVLALADEIHSVDSPRLLQTLLQHADTDQRHPGIYLQVKLNDEPNKSGFEPTAIPGALEEVTRSGQLPLLGLMTMAPLVEPERGRPEALRTFRELALLAADLPRESFHADGPLLSMGMSGDFEEAVSAGSHILRVGSALFAEAPDDSRARATREENSIER